MTSTVLHLLDRPPQTITVLPASDALDPDAVEFVAETDTLLAMCSCAASSDLPDQGWPLRQRVWQDARPTGIRSGNR